MQDLPIRIAILRPPGNPTNVQGNLTGSGTAECAKALMLRKKPSAGSPPVSDTAGSLRAAARFKPADRGPGGGLTATYCTQLGMTKHTTPPTRNAHFCFREEAEMGTRWVKLGPSWAQVGVLEASEGHLGGNLAKKMASWRQVGGKLEVRWPKNG